MSRDAANSIAQRAGYGVAAADGTQFLRAPINHGCIPGARFAASQNPANGNTVVIGGFTFQFVTALGAKAANVQVKILGTAALTYAALVDAINGVATDLNWLDGTTPFGLAVVADMVTATQFRLRAAAARGGLPLPSVSGSVALAVTITSGATAWTTTNLNQNGKLPADCDQAYAAHTVSAAEITAGFIDIELDFQPTLYDIFVVTAAGVQKVITEVVTIPSNQKSLHITTGTGGTPLAATDVLNWWAGA